MNQLNLIALIPSVSVMLNGLKMPKAGGLFGTKKKQDEALAATQAALENSRQKVNLYRLGF